MIPTIWTCSPSIHEQSVLGSDQSGKVSQPRAEHKLYKRAWIWYESYKLRECFSKKINVLGKKERNRGTQLNLDTQQWFTPGDGPIKKNRSSLKALYIPSVHGYANHGNLFQRLFCTYRLYFTCLIFISWQRVWIVLACQKYIFELRK
jgi:hypothetical protein